MTFQVRSNPSVVVLAVAGALLVAAQASRAQTAQAPEVPVRGVVEDYEDVASAHGHSLRLEVDGPVPAVVGHERLLQEALVNYVFRARGARYVIVHRGGFGPNKWQRLARALPALTAGTAARTPVCMT